MVDILSGWLCRLIYSFLYWEKPFRVYSGAFKYYRMREGSVLMAPQVGYSMVTLLKTENVEDVIKWRLLTRGKSYNRGWQRGEIYKPKTRLGKNICMAAILRLCCHYVFQNLLARCLRRIFTNTEVVARRMSVMMLMLRAASLARKSA